MKILVADDDRMIRMITRRRLEEWGYTVVECEDGEAALTILRGEDPPRIAVLDWVMPKKTGVEVAHALQEEKDRPLIYCILLTSKTEREDRLRALSMGAHDFQGKPVDYEELHCRLLVAQRLLDAEDRLAKYAEEMKQLAMSRAEELIRADKMAALGNVSAAMAHEVKTPMGNAYTATTHFVEKLRQIRASFTENKLTRTALQTFLMQAEEAGEMIERNLRRANELMQSFKTIAVDQVSEEKRPFNLKSYIQETLLSLHPQLKKTKITVDVSCPENLVVHSYPGAFSQIITNLINNSLMHAYDADATGRISIEVRLDETNLIFVYRDDGKGIPPDVLPRIFEPFFTTRRGTGGSGLGMSILRDIAVNMLHGNLECTSEVGKGATFTLTIPRREVE